jgi:hypothetical protein
MGALEIIALALQFALELWKSSKKTPEEIKLDAIAKITRDMNNDIEKFNKALVTNDADAISLHFEQLRLQSLQAGSRNPR